MPAIRMLAFALAVVNLSIVSAAPSDAGALPSSLQTCLSKTRASVLYPGNQKYDALSKAQNSNYQPHPEVIVVPASAEEVAAVVRCVAAEKGNVKLSPRGGGHSYAAYSLSGQVVVDPSNMKSITFDDEKRQVTVQFGQTLGPLAKALGQKGYALPHGTCPGVGVAGHSLGGGWGFPSRKWGWLVDHIVSLEFVDVDGNIKLLNSGSTGHDAELWWAVRGAGANNFGIITSFTFAMEMAPTSTVNYEYHFTTDSDCTQVLLEVQGLGILPANDPKGLPVELGMEVLFIGRSERDERSCYLSGQYLGKKAAFLPVINKVLDKLGKRGIKPVSSETKIKEFKDWIAALTDLMGPLDGPNDPLPYYAQSLMDSGTPNYKKPQVDRVFQAIQVAKSIQGTENDVSFDLLGPGAETNDPPSTGDMSYIHRRSLFLIQIYSAYFPGYSDPTARADALDKITNITTAIKQASPQDEWHSYQNYIDPYLKNFGQEYYGSGLGRLKSLKSVTDPHMIFDSPQGLGHA
ncbi:hypothetical protein BBP40_011272 [Aspergillus hancockii]|nr:hypothetical protein BBP40_011272 [Aspergillus hancockii]